MFVLSDKALAHVPRPKIREQLLEVGFDDARQAEVVGGLSGGWKMKLELARAMLYNADLLLLDEVRMPRFPQTSFADLHSAVDPMSSPACVDGLDSLLIMYVFCHASIRKFSN